jgi:hypothetical protein
VNLLFQEKVDYMRASEDVKKKLPIIFDGKSLVVAKTEQISNLKLIQDLSKVVDYIDNIDIFLDINKNNIDHIHY